MPQDLIGCAIGSILLVSIIEWVGRYYLRQYKESRDTQTRIKMNRRYSHNHKAA